MGADLNRGSAMHKPRRLLRESVAVLAMRILLVQLIIALASLIANASLLSMSSFDTIGIAHPMTGLISTLGAADIILQMLDAVLVVWLVLRWVNTVYLITPDVVVVRTGLRRASKAVHKIGTIESPYIRQSPLGKLLNYGSIHFYNSLLKDEATLANIPNPDTHTQLLEKQS